MKISRIGWLFVLVFSVFFFTANAKGEPFTDDFSTDSTGDYTVTQVYTGGGTGIFLYDGAEQRAQLLTGDNINTKFSHATPLLDTGTFSIDFLPTQKYPSGGRIFIYLKEDDDNYYVLHNTDGYGPGEIKKVVDGFEQEVVPFQYEYSQDTPYTLRIIFSPGSTTVEAFGEVLLLDMDNSIIEVSSFEIRLNQQDAYFDNILFAAPDTDPPDWDDPGEIGVGGPGACPPEDNASGGSVTVHFGSATDAVSGSNVRYNLYYAPTASWIGTDWSANTMISDVSVEFGTVCVNSYTLNGLVSGAEYTFGIRVEDESSNEDANENIVTLTPTGEMPEFSTDDFSTDSTGDYTVTQVYTGGGTGIFLYDGAEQRAQLLTGDNINTKFSHATPLLDTGTFSIEFLPTQKYPSGGRIIIYLKEDDDNYYVLHNTDGYGPGEIKKVVDGFEQEVVPFQYEYSQDTPYTLRIIFSPGSTTVEAFGEVLLLDMDNSIIEVSSFEVRLNQQDAYFDNILFANSQAPLSAISDPLDGEILTGSSADPYLISGTATDDISVTGVEISIDGGTSWTPVTCTDCPGFDVNWTYSWALPAEGIYTLRSRATDSGGNVETPGSGNTVSIDRTGPAVITTDPADAASGVVLDGAVTIDWGEIVDCATVDTLSVTISPAVGWTRASCSGSQAVFTPSGQIEATVYTVTVGTAVTDSAGNPMVANYQFSYTTGLIVTVTPTFEFVKDNFSTDSTDDYTVTQVYTGGGTGIFLYDGAEQRAQLLTGDNINTKFFHATPLLDTGTFSIDFLPTQKYPSGGRIIIYLKEDDDNYYVLHNTDGYGPGEIKKVVDGFEQEVVPFQYEYSQDTPYTLRIIFSPGSTTVEAFGEVLLLDLDNSIIEVSSFEIRLNQQDAYFDNILFAAPDTDPPDWDDPGEIGVGGPGACPPEDNASGGSVTVHFGSATDAVSGSNVRYNLYYAPTASWIDADWSANAMISDVSVEFGTVCANAYTVTGLVSGIEYTFGIRVEDESSNEDTNENIVTVTPTFEFVKDNFSTDSTDDYTVTQVYTGGGTGIFLYDGAEQRAQLLTGDNINTKFSHATPLLDTGTFSIDFLPTQKYPSGGRIFIYLKKDDNNYYALHNTDGYGPGEVRKIVNGVEQEVVFFQNEYTQNTPYTLRINFNPGSTTVEAFGEVLLLDLDNSIIEVSSFEVQLNQQDAYFDNILFTDEPTVTILSPQSYYLQSSPDLLVHSNVANLPGDWGVKYVLTNLTTLEKRTNFDFSAPFEHSFTGLDKDEHTIEAFIIDGSFNSISGELSYAIKYNIGIGDYYVAFGDSITLGSGDDVPADGFSDDGRNGHRGFEPILNDLLTDVRGYPHTIENEGVGGEESIDGLARIQSVIDAHPEAQYFLVLFGTNDSSGSMPVPSGLGLIPGETGYSGSYKDNMQQIINAIFTAGKQPMLAKIPIALGPCSICIPFPDPDIATRNTDFILEYNLAINELVSANGITVATPDLYTYFTSIDPDTTQLRYQTEYSDNLHPNGIGYNSIADLWTSVLTLQ